MGRHVDFPRPDLMRILAPTLLLRIEEAQFPDLAAAEAGLGPYNAYSADAERSFHAKLSGRSTGS
jgi:hypothetical protein